MLKKALAGAAVAASAAVGEQHGLINTNGAPFLNLDLRCAVPNADGSVSHAFLGNKNSCSEAPVDQFHKGGILS